VTSRRRILVLADSLAFHGPQRAEPASEPRLWPNVAAAELDGAAELFAGFGWTARDAWWALTGNPRVWAVMPSIDAVVLGVGSMDALPSPLPTYLRTGLRYLRPDAVRRRARVAYLAAQPGLSRALAVVARGRPVALPPAVTVRYLERCRRAVHGIRPGLPIVGVLPAPHRAAAYGYVHSGRSRAAAAVASWAVGAGVPLVDLGRLVTPHLLAGDANPDGMHWGWAGHRAVGHAVAAAVLRAALFS
jgi:diglucosylglycerate octanoyltransferase